MTDLHIDIDRLIERLAALAEIGAIAGTEGCARLALTDEDRAGRDLVVSWMHDLELDVTIDGEVVAEAGGVVPGLYAIGGCASNIAQDGTGYSSGTCIGESTFFGRRAGLKAASSA